MSNYAPDPKKSNLYDQLVTRSVENVTAEDITILTNPVKLSSVNQDQLIMMKIINDAVMRDGSPMPNSMKIVSTTFTDNSRNVIFTVNKGEVYQLMTIGAVATNPSGDNAYQFFMGGTDTDGLQALLKWYYYSTTNNTGPVFQGDADFPDMPMYFDESTTMQLEIGGTFDSVKVQVAMIRVR